MKLTRFSVVCVTGLDGNAFGSWTSRATGLMWPRDFLREDLPRARVLTFGYNTKLLKDMNYNFQDFCDQFMSHLQLARKEVKCTVFLKERELNSPGARSNIGIDWTQLRSSSHYQGVLNFSLKLDFKLTFFIPL
jgi:hypothetical protein